MMVQMKCIVIDFSLTYLTIDAVESEDDIRGGRDQRREVYTHRYWPTTVTLATHTAVL